MQHNDKTVSNQGRPRAAKAAKNPYSNGHCPNSNLTPSLALRLALSLSDLSMFQHNLTKHIGSSTPLGRFFSTVVKLQCAIIITPSLHQIDSMQYIGQKTGVLMKMSACY